MSHLPEYGDLDGNPGVLLPYHEAPEDEADMSVELREQLAAYAHEAWSGWMQYMVFNCAIVNTDGSVTIPADKVARWLRQLSTEFSQLPQNEKESDRAEADKMMAIIAAISAPPTVDALYKHLHSLLPSAGQKTMLQALVILLRAKDGDD